MDIGIRFGVGYWTSGEDSGEMLYSPHLLGLYADRFSC